MKFSAYLVAGSLVLAIGDTQVRMAYADDVPFKLRNTISAGENPLSDHLTGRPEWVLRSAADGISDQSLVSELRPSYSTADGFPGFTVSSIQRSDALRANLYDSNASHQAVKTAQFNLLPTISMIGEMRRDTSRLSSAQYAGNIDTRQARVEAQWVVYSGGANWAALRAARYTAEASDWNYLAAERQIFLGNSGVYLETVSSQKLVSAIANTVRRLKRIRHSTQAQYQAGLTSKTDIAQVDAEIASVRSQLEAARSRLKQQRIAYRDLVGRPAPDWLKDPKVAHLLPKSKDAAIERALQSNHAINAAYATHGAAVENSNVAKGQLLPRISVFANASTRDVKTVDPDRDYDWSAGVRVEVPLVNLSTNSRYHEARAQAISSEFRARDTVRLVRRDVETSWVNYHSLKKQNRLLARQSAAIKRSIKGLKSQVEIGLRPIGDLLREEIRLTENEMSRIQIQFQMKVAALRIAIQFSDLTLDDIARI